MTRAYTKIHDGCGDVAFEIDFDGHVVRNGATIDPTQTYYGDDGTPLFVIRMTELFRLRGLFDEEISRFSIGLGGDQVRRVRTSQITRALGREWWELEVTREERRAS